MSTLKVDTILKRSGTGTITLGQSGDTITIPSGATINLSNATQTGVGGVNTPAFEANLSGSNQDIGDSSNTRIAFNSEVFDTDNAFDSSSNYRFTPQTAGKYFVYAATVGFTSNGGYDDLQYMSTEIKKNGTRISHLISDLGSRQRQVSQFVAITVDMNGSSDYLDVFCEINAHTGTGVLRAGADKTKFGAFRIIT